METNEVQLGPPLVPAQECLAIRWYPAYWAKRYLRDRHGLKPKTMEYHIKKGRIPDAKYWLWGEPVYNDERIKVVMAYFKGRKYCDL